MPEETIPINKEEAMLRLKELVLDHLSIPRPKQSTHIQKLQDDLLPAFMNLARLSWLAASPLPLEAEVFGNILNHPIYQYLQRVSETHTEKVRELNRILEQ